MFFVPFKTSKSDTFKQLGRRRATDGSQRGTLTQPNLPTYKTAAQQTSFRYRSDARLRTSLADGRHWRVGPQACTTSGPVGLLTE